MNLKQLNNTLLRNESKIYLWLCVGIVYSLLFWTLINSILCISLFVYWLIWSKKSFTLTSGKGRLLFVFILLYLISLIGMTYTFNVEEGVFRLQQKLPLLIFPLIFGTTDIITLPLVKKILLHFIIAVSINCTISLAYGINNYFHTWQTEMLTGYNLMLFPDTYANVMGILCLTGVIFCFLFFKEFSGRRKIFLGLALILLSVYILLLSIRLIIALLVIVIMLFILQSINNIKYRILFISTLFILAISASLLVPSLQKKWIELTDFSKENTIKLDEDSSLGRAWGGQAIRIAIWKCSKDILKEHWLIGVGTGDIQDTLQQTYENRKFYFASRFNKYNAHNQYLQMTIGYGIPGLILLLLCIIAPFFKPRNPINKFYYLFLLSFLSICFTEVILDVNKGVIWYSFFNSILAFSVYKKEKTTIAI